MFRILDFYDSPWVQTTSDLLPLHLDQLVGADHSEGNTCLGEELQRVRSSGNKNQRSINGEGISLHLEDSRLLLELFVLVRVRIWKLVDFDAVLSDLIQDLRREEQENTESRPQGFPPRQEHPPLENCKGVFVILRAGANKNKKSC